MSSQRDLWAGQSDSELLGQCEIDTYRASGPGGQKRNKTSSAVRLRHKPSGLLVIAEESRSQHDNKAKALKRVRQAFYLQLRDKLSDTVSEDRVQSLETYEGARDGRGRLSIGKKDRRFWPVVGVVLDVLQTVEARVSDAANLLGISTANLIDFLSSHPKVWEQVAHMRVRFGLKPLKHGK